VRRSDLRLLLLEAHRLTSADEVLVIGSQSVLATWDEDELPVEATRSLEADMLVRVRNGIRLTDQQADEVTQFLELSGMMSEFDESMGSSSTPSVRPPQLCRMGGGTGSCLSPSSLMAGKR
jgi:hypothetical protein